MRRELSKIVRDLENAQARLDTLTATLSGDLWARRHDPAQWSPAECVAHLNLTSEAYIPLIRTAIEEARQLPRARSGQYRRDLLGWLFSMMTGPLPSLGRRRLGRVKTTAAFVPAGAHPREEVLAQFKRDQDELIRLVKEADGLALDQVLIRSPFGGKIRYNCYSAFVILPRHQDRHLDQAERVWASPED
ncbi:MAG TPA: DinB family protein [Gemmatimonadaceae bacterium]|nr:DinB family protein [Gemmatimonadaceae bacterium]